LLEVLSRRPQQAWPEGVLHHGVRILLLLSLVLLSQLLFPVSPVPDFPNLEKGMVPERDVIAEVPFLINKTDAELAQERDNAAAAVAPIYRFDPTAVDTMLRRVRTFLAGADSAARATPTQRVQIELRDLLQRYGFPADSGTLSLLSRPEQRRALRVALERIISSELPKGIVASSDESPDPQWREVRQGTEQLVPRDSVLTQPRLFEHATAYVPAGAPAGFGDLLTNALIRFFESSLRFDRAATNQARAQARAVVPQVKASVVEGQRIVTAHEPVGDAELERLAAYQDALQAAGASSRGPATVAREIGSFGLNLLVLSIFGLLLFFYRPATYGNIRHVLLLVALIAALLASAAVVDNTGAPVELVPIAFPALVVAGLWDGRMALNLTLVLAALLSVQLPFSNISPHMVLLLAGAAAALSMRVVHRRAQGLLLGAIIAAVYAATALMLGLMRNREAAEILNGVMWGVVNGVASALLAMGFMPLFEGFTRITTDQTLLELADLNRPILKRLSLEASGTYAHSINVANLAEAAARAIDANPLLTRVGAYYHDIGKIVMPQYFIENQARGRNPHDQLDPLRSASIVRQHVLEGVRLAEQARLPDCVTRFIPEHHGTQPIGFFYEQARQAAPDTEIDPAPYSYPGPRPQTRETVILMLADSVESAAKVLPDPTAERMRALVDRIVERKLELGQLDDAPLTLQELSRIKDQFVVVLMGMYHHRIDYPTAPLLPEEPAVASSGAED